ncbi:MAG: response regulator transcription factor [Elusimicrobiota bacterium]
MNKKILVIDDIESVRKSVVRALRQNNFPAVSAADGSDGLLLVKEVKPDLVLTDADMPGMDGHALCRVLRKDKSTQHIPIIIMSGSMTGDNDVVAGLRDGADGYVAKPISMSLLLARIRAVLRRYADVPSEGASLKMCGIDIDHAAREVRVSDKVIRLTRKEFDLLSILMSNPGRVTSPASLLESVWGHNPADCCDVHTVETHISRLRKKLGPKVSQRIVNVPSLGYKFEN